MKDNILEFKKEQMKEEGIYVEPKDNSAKKIIATGAIVVGMAVSLIAFTASSIKSYSETVSGNAIMISYLVDGQDITKNTVHLYGVYNESEDELSDINLPKTNVIYSNGFSGEGLNGRLNIIMSNEPLNGNFVSNNGIVDLGTKEVSLYYMEGTRKSQAYDSVKKQYYYCEGKYYYISNNKDNGDKLISPVMDEENAPKYLVKDMETEEYIVVSYNELLTMDISNSQKCFLLGFISKENANKYGVSIDANRMYSTIENSNKGYIDTTKESYDTSHKATVLSLK